MPNSGKLPGRSNFAKHGRSIADRSRERGIETNPFELYLIIAPIAAAFAGFGSLASSLGQRRGDDSRVDATRLALMLFASLSATLLGLLPATLAALSLDVEFAVRVSAFVALVTILSYAAVGVRRVRKLRHIPGFSKAGVLANLFCALTAFAAFALCLLGIPPDRGSALYLLGLMGLLGSSVVMFSRVISSILRPHDEFGDAQ